MSINMGDLTLNSHDAITNKYYIESDNLCFGYFDTIDKIDASKIVDGENKLIGECVTIAMCDFEHFLQEFGINILKKYNVHDRLVIEGVSKRLPYFNKNQNFNVQISIYDNIAKIGSPALLDSF